MKRFVYPFKLTIVMCFYLSIANFILLILVWWLGDSIFRFLEVLYFLRKPVLRLLMGETLIITFIAIVLYWTYVDFELPLYRLTPLSMGLMLGLLRLEEDENTANDIAYINKLALTAFGGGVGVVIIGYLFFEDMAEQELLLQLILAILPLMIASMFVVLLFVPITLTVFFLGSLIIKYTRR